MTPETTQESATGRLARVAAEIAALANSNISADAFVKGLLERVIDALGARAAAMWGLSTQGVLALAGEINLVETGVTHDTGKSRLNIRRLMDVSAASEVVVHDPQPVARAGSQLKRGTVPLGNTDRNLEARSLERDSPLFQQAAAPVISPAAIPAANFPVLMAPVSTKRRCVGVLEVFLSCQIPSEEWIDVRQFVEGTCSSAGYYLAWREESASKTSIAEFWDRYDQTVNLVHGSLDPRLVAMTAVNEGRRLLNCDRLSLVVQRGRRAEVIAVSGQERVNRASNLVRSLADLALLAIGSNRQIGTVDGVGDGSTGMPAAIEKAVLEHLQTGGARLVQVIPLRKAPTHPTGGIGSVAAPPAFAALVFEQFTEAWLSPLASERLIRYASHVGGALHNARAHHHVFLLPLRRLIGRIGSHMTGRPLVKLILALMVFGGAVAGALYVPAPYRVEGKGKLMPAIQSSVFAPWDGEVTSVYVTGGEWVEAGQPLAQMHNDELQSQLLTAQNRAAEKRQMLDALQAEISEGNRRTNAAPDDVVRLRGRLAQTRIELEDAIERGSSLERQIEQLTVRSPIAGTVASFQIERTLLSRPVRRGEVLLEVMDEDGDWRLEIAVPEQRLGHLLAAQSARPDERLPAEFVLATTPEETYHGEVDLIASRTNTTPDQGAVVNVHVAVNTAEIKHRRIGAEATSKIDCGQKSLAYVLFGDAVEFVQRRLW